MERISIVRNAEALVGSVTPELRQPQIEVIPGDVVEPAPCSHARAAMEAPTHDARLPRCRDDVLPTVQIVEIADASTPFSNLCG
jgi:hypothetical protein